MKTRFLFLILIIQFGCKIPEQVKPNEESEVNFTFTPISNNGNYILTKDSLDLSISISSIIPETGLIIQIEAKRSFDDKLIYTLDTLSKQNNVLKKISGFEIKGNYLIKITISSKNKPSNSSTKTLQVARNRIAINYLKPSYELFSKVKIWQEYPRGYATVAKLDFDGDGFEDFVWFEGYDPTKSYNWPGPIFEKFNGTNFIKQTFSLPNAKLFAEKILIGDFNNDSYPDLFLVSHMDAWAGCTNCNPTPTNPPHIIFNSENGFNLVKSFNDITGDWTPGCSGDIDNDGDLDVLLFSHHQDVSPSSRALINNGIGEFTYENFGIGDIEWADRAELIDLNNDGFLDLIINDVVDENGYANRFRIFWGNGKPFSKENSIRLPYSNQLFIISISAEDIDNDNIREIITVGSNINGEWEISILKTVDFITYKDITQNSIKDYIKQSKDGIMNGPMQVQDLNRDGKMDIFTADKRLNLIWQKNESGIYVRKSL